jgi:dolichol-phosphate mannosyltransferase
VKLSVVIPAYNEEKNLGTLHARLTAVLASCCDDHEIVFVNDGSRDHTLEGLRALARSDRRVKYLNFSRNFGHEVAVAAGMDRADGDAVILIDADLQDPPELIREMVSRWSSGIDVVYAQRRKRRGDGLLKKLAIFVFYRLMSRIAEIDIPLDTGNFRLMDRRVVEAVKRCRENPRYVRGLVPWVGFRQEAVHFDRDPRHAGQTGYGFMKLVKLAMDGVFSFSMVPLKISTWIGGLMVGLSILGTLVVVADKLWVHPDVPKGFAFLACAMFFLGGVQMFMLGMLAQYVGYIFRNVQNRPMYIVAEEAGWEPGMHPIAPTSIDQIAPLGAGTDAVRVVVRAGVGNDERVAAGGDLNGTREGAPGRKDGQSRG